MIDYLINLFRSWFAIKPEVHEDLEEQIEQICDCDRL